MLHIKRGGDPMRKLRKPKMLLDGDHFKILYEKRKYGENIVEIIHVFHKRTDSTYELYSSNYVSEVSLNNSNGVSTKIIIR